MRTAALAVLVATLGFTALFFGGTLWWAGDLAAATLALLALAMTLAGLRAGAALPRDPGLVTAALALATALLSLTVSVNRFATLEWLRVVLAAGAAYALAALLPRSRRAVHIALWLLFTGALAAALYGAWVTLSGREMVLWFPKQDYRDSLTGTFINRNHFASWLALHLYLGLGLFAAASRRTRALLLGPLAFGLLALGLTLSRGGLLATCAAAPLFLALIGGHTRRRLLLAGVALVLALSALAATNWHRLAGRLEDSFDAHGEPSMRARVSIWDSTLQAFRDRPLLGFGAGTFRSFYPRYREVGLSRRVDFAHQDWLELGAEQGIVGGLGALCGGTLLLLALARALRRSGPDRPIVAGLVSGIAVVVLHAGVDFPLEIPAVLYSSAAAAGFAVALGRLASPPAAPLSRRGSRVCLVLAGVVLAAGAVRSLQCLAASHHLARGDEAFREVAWDRALPEYRRAVALDPVNPQGWYALARTEQNKGKFQGRDGKEAVRELREQALAHHDEAKRRDPLNGDYDLERAWLLNFMGRKEEAAAAYAEAIANDPANANTLYLAGSFHLWRRERERGLELIARALACWPRFFGTKIFEIDRTVGDPERLLAIIPGDQPFLIYQYATFLLEQERFEPARQVFHRALQSGGWRGDWIVPFAGAIAARVSREAALEIYAKMPPSSRTPLTDIEVVKLLMGAGREDEARRVLAEAQERFPDSGDLLLVTRRWAAGPEQVADAAEAYRSARGEDSLYHVTRGELALAAGDALAALAEFERAQAFARVDGGAAPGAARSLERLAESAESGCDVALADAMRLLARDYVDR